MHLNIWSVPKHCHEFALCWYCLNYNLPLIGLSETWFTVENVDCYKLLGYNIINHVRTDGIGGDASLMIRNTIPYTVRSSLKVFGTYIECIFIEIGGTLINYDTNVTIGTVYRPPSTDIKEFNESVSPLLVKMQNEHKLAYIMDDYNINLLNTDKHLQTSECVDIMLGFG